LEDERILRKVTGPEWIVKSAQRLFGAVSPWSSKHVELDSCSPDINSARAWSLCVGRVPQIDLKDIRVHKPIIVDEIEREEWVPYTDDGLAQNSASRQEGNMRLVFKSFSDLSELVHKATYTLYSDQAPLSGHKILAIYTEYLQWYEKLPDQLRLGGNSTPTVLFTQ